MPTPTPTPIMKLKDFMALPDFLSKSEEEQDAALNDYYERIKQLQQPKSALELKVLTDQFGQDVKDIRAGTSQVPLSVPTPQESKTSTTVPSSWQSVANAGAAGFVKGVASPLNLVDWATSFATESPYARPGAFVDSLVDKVYPIPENEQDFKVKIASGLGNLGSFLLPTSMAARSAAATARAGKAAEIVAEKAAQKAASRTALVMGEGMEAGSLQEEEAKAKRNTGKSPSALQHLAATPGYAVAGLLDSLTPTKLATTGMGKLGATAMGAYLEGSTEAAQTMLESGVNKIVYKDPATLGEISDQIKDSLLVGTITGGIAGVGEHAYKSAVDKASTDSNRSLRYETPSEQEMRKTETQVADERDATPRSTFTEFASILDQAKLSGDPTLLTLTHPRIPRYLDGELDSTEPRIDSVTGQVVGRQLRNGLYYERTADGKLGVLASQKGELYEGVQGDTNVPFIPIGKAEDVAARGDGRRNILSWQEVEDYYNTGKKITLPVEALVDPEIPAKRVGSFDPTVFRPVGGAEPSSYTSQLRNPKYEAGDTAVGYNSATGKMEARYISADGPVEGFIPVAPSWFNLTKDSSSADILAAMKEQIETKTGSTTLSAITLYGDPISNSLWLGADNGQLSFWPEVKANVDPDRLLGVRYNGFSSREPFIRLQKGVFGQSEADKLLLQALDNKGKLSDTLSNLKTKSPYSNFAELFSPRGILRDYAKEVAEDKDNVLKPLINPGDTKVPEYVDLHPSTTLALSDQAADEYQKRKLADKRLEPRDSQHLLLDPSFRPAVYDLDQFRSKIDELERLYNQHDYHNKAAITNLISSMSGYYYAPLSNGRTTIVHFDCLPDWIRYENEVELTFLQDAKSGLTEDTAVLGDITFQKLRSFKPFAEGEKDYKADDIPLLTNGKLAKGEEKEVVLSSAAQDTSQGPVELSYPDTTIDSAKQLDSIVYNLLNPTAPNPAKPWPAEVTVYRGDNYLRPDTFKYGGGGVTLGRGLYTTFSFTTAKEYGDILSTIKVRMPERDKVLLVSHEGDSLYAVKYIERQGKPLTPDEGFTEGDDLVATIINEALQGSPVTVDMTGELVGSSRRYGDYLTKKLRDLGYEAVLCDRKMREDPGVLDKTLASTYPALHSSISDKLAQTSQLVVLNPALTDFEQAIVKTPPIFDFTDETQKLDDSFRLLGITDTLGVNPVTAETTRLATWGPRSPVSAVGETGLVDPTTLMQNTVLGKKQEVIAGTGKAVKYPTKAGYQVGWFSQTLLTPETTLQGRPLSLHTAGIETQQLGTDRAARGEVILDTIEVGLSKEERLDVRKRIEDIQRLDESRKKTNREIKRLVALANKKGAKLTLGIRDKIAAKIDTLRDDWKNSFDSAMSKYSSKVTERSTKLVQYFRDLWHDNMRSLLITEHFNTHYGEDKSAYLGALHQLEVGTNPRDIAAQYEHEITLLKDNESKTRDSLNQAKQMLRLVKNKPDTDPEKSTVKAQVAHAEEMLEQIARMKRDFSRVCDITGKDPIAFITNLEKGGFVISEDKEEGKVLHRSVTRAEHESKLAEIRAKGIAVKESVESDWANPLAERKNVLAGTQDIFKVIRYYNSTINTAIVRRPWEAVYEQEKKTDAFRDKSITNILDNTKKQLQGGKPSWLETLVDSLIVQGSRTKLGRILGLSQIDPSIGGAATRGLGSLNAESKLGYKVSMTAVNLASGYIHTTAKVGVEYTAKGQRFRHTPEGIQLLKENAPYLDSWAGVDVLTGVGKGDTAVWKPLGLHRWAEESTRDNSFLANYLYLRDQGLTAEASVVAARQAMRTQQFAYTSAAMPRILASKDARLLLQFKSYMLSEASFLKTLTAKQLVSYIGMMVTMGGPKALLVAVKTIPILGMLTGHEDDFNNWILQNLVNDEVMSGYLGMVAHGDISSTVAPTFTVPTKLEDMLGAWNLVVNLEETIRTSGLSVEGQALGLKKYAYENIVPIKSVMDAFAVAKAQKSTRTALERIGLLDKVVGEYGVVKHPITGKPVYQLESYWNIPKLLMSITPLEKARVAALNSETIALNKRAIEESQKMFDKWGIQPPTGMDMSDPAVQQYYRTLSDKAKTLYMLRERALLEESLTVNKEKVSRIINAPGYQYPKVQ